MVGGFEMKRKKAIAISIASFLALSVMGLALYGFFIPGNIFSLLKTGSYTKTIDGSALFAGNENGHEYMAVGNTFTSTGNDPYFVIDISSEPQFDFVRIDVSDIKYPQWVPSYIVISEIYWADSGESFSGTTTTGYQELINGVNIFQLPADRNIQALRFDLADAPNVSFNINSLTFTNNWYLPPLTVALIIILSLTVSLIVFDVLAREMKDLKGLFSSLFLEGTTLPKERRERNILGLFCVLTATIPLAYLAVMTLIKTNTYLDTERIEQLYTPYLSLFAPEPHEFQRFVLYCVLICVFSLGFTLLYRKHMDRIPYTTVRRTNPALFSLSALLFFATLYAVGNFSNGYYLTYMSFSGHFFLAIALFALAAAALLSYQSVTKKFPKLRLAVYLFDAAVVGFVSYFSSFFRYCNNRESDGQFAYHFAVVFNPIYELSQGHTPGVDFDPLYGLYGYFFYWVQKIIWGGIHYRDTVTLMGALVFIGNMAIYIFLVKMLRQRFAAAITLAAVIFFAQILHVFIFFSLPHYAYFPIRTIVPAITLCLISFIHTARSEKARFAFFAAAALVAAEGILWNPETGLVAALTLAGYMIYCALCEHNIMDKEFWKKTAIALSMLTGCFLACFLALQLITISRTGGGGYPPSRLLWGIQFLAGDGYNMYPLPEKHPYILALGIYSVAVVLSLYSLFISKAKPNKEARDNALGFATAIMGFGLFLYFLGRSPKDSFTVSTWPAFIVLAFIALKLSDYFKQKFAEWRKSGYGREDVLGLVSGTLAGALSLAFVFFLFATGLSLYTVSNLPITSSYNALRKNVSIVSPETFSAVEKYQTDRMFVVDYYPMFYLNDLNLKNDYRGRAFGDCFFKEDLLNIITQLEEYNGRVFVSESVFSADNVFDTKRPLADGETFQEKILKTLNERFVPLAKEGGWYVYDYAGG
jgi:hypothetical protein